MLFQISRENALDALDAITSSGYPEYARCFEIALLQFLFSEVNQATIFDSVVVTEDAYRAYLRLTN